MVVLWAGQVDDKKPGTVTDAMWASLLQQRGSRENLWMNIANF